jgi:hypothetical protein
VPPPCTTEYIWEETTFSFEVQASHSQTIADEGLEAYFTVLSAFGWAGCAAPKACIPCASVDIVVDEEYTECSACLEHQAHLHPGQMDWDSFRCLSGDECINADGRCNGHSQCGDGSDEEGCNTAWGVPAVMGAQECSDTFTTDTQFRCADNSCVAVAGRCNGVSNCVDGSDEQGCATTTQGLTLEAFTGFTATIETPAVGSMVFYDRQYTFDSLGSFSGHSFIKMSNEDKHIRHSHVQMKLRLPQPLTVYVAKLDDTSLPWLAAEGWEISSLQGVSYSGVRQTRHTDWSGELHEDHYGPGAVYKKTFPAGAIELRGNNGGDGSYVLFAAHPDNAPTPPAEEFDSRLSAYWESGNCGVHGNDWNWHWCSHQAGNCPTTVSTLLCDSGEAELAEYHGTGAANSYTRNGCNYFWHAQYRCTEAQPVAGSAEFIGCFIDDGHRDLGAMIGGTNSAGTNTFELCRAACGDSLYMALQYGGECFCADAYATASQYVQVDESECGATNEPCFSNSYNCGGTWRQAIYQINHPVVTTPVFSHVHAGHCNGGWLGSNSGQASAAACSAHCSANADCHYFAFCDGGSCDGSTNCAMYNEAAGCPNDNNWGDYEAYVNHDSSMELMQLKYMNPDVGSNGLCVSMTANMRDGAGCSTDGCVNNGASDATMQTCDTMDAGQMFSYDASTGLLHSAMSGNNGRCLTVGASSTHGACEPFTLAACDAGNTRQQFDMEAVSGSSDQKVWRNIATHLAIDSDSWRNTVDNWIWACPGTNTAKYFGAV